MWQQWPPQEDNTGHQLLTGQHPVHHQQQQPEEFSDVFGMLSQPMSEFNDLSMMTPFSE